MWMNLPPAKVDIYGAESISYHLALMMTTDLKFTLNTIYSAADVFAMINTGYGMIRRSSATPALSLEWIKRALSTKWARTGLAKLFPMNIEFGLSRGGDDIIQGEFGRGQYIKFMSPQVLCSFETEDRKAIEVARIRKSLMDKYHSNKNNYAGTMPIGLATIECLPNTVELPLLGIEAADILEHPNGSENDRFLVEETSQPQHEEKKRGRSVVTAEAKALETRKLKRQVIALQHKVDEFQEKNDRSIGAKLVELVDDAGVFRTKQNGTMQLSLAAGMISLAQTSHVSLEKVGQLIILTSFNYLHNFLYSFCFCKAEYSECCTPYAAFRKNKSR
jgi:hypothetical protein